MDMTGQTEKNKDLRRHNTERFLVRSEQNHLLHENRQKNTQKTHERKAVSSVVLSLPTAAALLYNFSRCGGPQP